MQDLTNGGDSVGTSSEADEMKGSSSLLLTVSATAKVITRGLLQLINSNTPLCVKPE